MAYPICKKCNAERLEVLNGRCVWCLDKEKEDHLRSIGALRLALAGLCHEKGEYYPSGCWCGHCLSDPNYREHSGACLLAQGVMGRLEK